MKQKAKPPSEVFAAAVDCLSRREYSAQELRRRLQQKGFDVALIDATIADLTERGWQSDQRAAEQRQRHAAQRCYGPKKLSADLRQRGLDESGLDTLATTCPDDVPDWDALALQALQKKFRSRITDRAKAQRFLLGRGFEYSSIRYALAQHEQDMHTTVQNELPR